MRFGTGAGEELDCQNAEGDGDSEVGQQSRHLGNEEGERGWAPRRVWMVSSDGGYKVGKGGSSTSGNAVVSGLHRPHAKAFINGLS